MSIVAWIVLGLVAGFVASKVVDHHGRGALLDIVLGVVGAMVGGYLFTLVGQGGITGLNAWSLFVSVIGAILVLMVHHAVVGGGRGRY